MRRFFNFSRRRCRRHDIANTAWRVAMVAAVAALAVTPSTPARAGGEKVVKVGAANHPLLIREHAAWNTDCRAVPYPALRLERPPQHGAVCARVAAITVRSMYTGTEVQCIGHVVQGLRLIYFPQPGFTGSDRLQYSVQYPSVRRRVSVTVSVGAGEGVLPADTVGAGLETGQAAGPVPPCASPVS